MKQNSRVITSILSGNDIDLLDDLLKHYSDPDISVSALVRLLIKREHKKIFHTKYPESPFKAS